MSLNVLPGTCMMVLKPPSTVRLSLRALRTALTSFLQGEKQEILQPIPCSSCPCKLSSEVVQPKAADQPFRHLASSDHELKEELGVPWGRAVCMEETQDVS